MKDEILIARDGEYFYLELKKLGLVAYGETIEEAFKNLGRAIEVAREGYLKENDENLTQDAIELKRDIMEIFEGDQMNFEDMIIGKTYLLYDTIEKKYKHYEVLARTRSGAYMLLWNKLDDTKEWYSLQDLAAKYSLVDEVVYR